MVEKLKIGEGSHPRKSAVIATKVNEIIDYISPGGGLTGSYSAGFVDYNDTATAITPITLPANTWVSITNNGAGAFTNTSYLPPGITRMMDTSNGKFLVDELALGSFFVVRNDFTITPSTNNAIVEQRYVLGAGANEYVLEAILGRLDSGSGKGYRFSLKPDFLYVGDLNTQQNPITLQIKLSTPGTLVNAGSAVGVAING